MVSCTTSAGTEQPSQAAMGTDLREPAPPAPWTSNFREPAILIANRVYIEGPKGLLEHVATRSVEEYHTYKAETVPEGFRQTYRVRRPEAGVELRAYLDALEVVAFEELIVIERPGKLDVRVRAQGDAYWRDSSTGKDRRSFEINLEGPVRQPE